MVSGAEDSKPYRNKEWLDEQINVLGKTQAQVARECGVTYNTINYWFRGAEQHKEYYKNNYKKIRNQQKEYYRNNCDKIKNLVKQYSDKNKDKISERNKLYSKKNKKKIIRKE